MSEQLKIGDTVRTLPGMQPEVRGVIVAVHRSVTGLRATIRTPENTLRFRSLRDLTKE